MKKEKIKINNRISEIIHPEIVWVLFIYFFSGLCSLIDEVVWLRVIKLTIGNTVYASSITISVFMGGLALGSLIMGHYADQIKRPLRLYSVLEFFAAISAVLFPMVMKLANILYKWFFVRYSDSQLVLLILQIFLSSMILLIPTMLMGSTLPLLSRNVTDIKNQIGRKVGHLYAINMLGAALGCFFAGFFLIKTLGIMGTLYFAAVMNLLVAGAGFLLSLKFEKIENDIVNKEIAPQQILDKLSGKEYILLTGFFISGFISISYELVWMRSIVFILNSFTYVFSAVLTVYLIGNVIGAYWGSRLSKILNNPGTAFGISISMLGFMGIIFIPQLTGWINFGQGLSIKIIEFAGMKDFSGVLNPMIHSFALFLIPSIIMGIGFPLALQVWCGNRREAGSSTGTVYGINTIGAVIGGITVGFIFIPLLGIQFSSVILGLTGIITGIVFLLFFTGNKGISGKIIYLIFPLLLAAPIFFIKPGMFINEVVNTIDRETVAIKEGVTTTVAITKSRDGHLQMALDNQFMAGDDIHRSAQQMLGNLGPLLNMKTRDILTVGFGGGETSACLSAYSTTFINCIEIAPEVVDMALKYFSHINLGEATNKKINLLYMDAKNYIYLTDKSYDLIINDSNDPETSGSAPLFTKEHFQSSLNHLKPGGLFITKVHLQGSSIESLNSIIGTFLDVYPSVTVWFPVSRPFLFLYFVGSYEKQIFSPAYIDNRLKEREIFKSSTYLKFRTSQDVLSCYICDEKELRKIITHYRENSDYKPFVEYNTNPKRLHLGIYFAKFMSKIRNNSLYNHIDWTGMNEKEISDWEKLYNRTFMANTYIINSHGEENPFIQLENYFEGLKIMPENITLMEKEKEILFFLRSNFDKELVSQGLHELIKRRPYNGSAWLLISWYLQYKQNMPGALDAAIKAIQYAPDNYETYNNIGIIYLKEGLGEEALKSFLKASELNPLEPGILFNIGAIYSELNNPNEAVSFFHRGLEIQPSNAKGHFFLGNIFEKLGNVNEAAKEYRETLKYAADYPGAAEKLKTVLRKTKY